jgi:hypothetical protein
MRILLIFFILILSATFVSAQGRLRGDISLAAKLKVREIDDYIKTVRERSQLRPFGEPTDSQYYRSGTLESSVYGRRSAGGELSESWYDTNDKEVLYESDTHMARRQYMTKTATRTLLVKSWRSDGRLCYCRQIISTNGEKGGLLSMLECYFADGRPIMWRAIGKASRIRAGRLFEYCSSVN